MTSEKTHVSAPDRTRLLLRTWMPDGQPRAVIVVVHGLGEHGGRYEHVGTRLAESGYLVRCVDLRGFGASDGSRAYVDRFDVYLQDLNSQVRDARASGVPVVVLGHSLGGLIAYAFARSGDMSPPDLLVLSSPALGANVPWAKKLAARVLSRIAPRLSIPNHLKGDQLSRDPEVGVAYFSDPLVYEKTTARLGAEMLGAMGVASAAPGPLKMPTLVMHGSDDTIVPPEMSAPLAGVAGVKRVVFEGFRHESFNEEGGEAALSTLIDGLDERLGEAQETPA